MLRSVLTVALVACLGAVAGSGCAGNEELRRIRVPKSGIALSYDLTPGVAYEGRLRLGNLVRADGAEPRKQSIEADLRLAVVGSDPGGTVLVRAALRRVELEWDLPPSTTLTAEQFTRLAGTQLEGMELVFDLSSKGEVTFMPEVPPGVVPEVAEAIAEIIDALASMFVVLPDRALRRGETWTHPVEMQSSGRTRRGKTDAKLVGLYRHAELGGRVARIDMRRESTELASDGLDERRVDRESHAVVLFSVDGFVAQLDGETRELDPFEGLRLRKLQVDLVKRQPVTGPRTGVETQIVADPCDADYVGLQACPDDAPEPETTPPAPAETPKEPSGIATEPPPLEDEDEDEAEPPSEVP